MQNFAIEPEVRMGKPDIADRLAELPVNRLPDGKQDVWREPPLRTPAWKSDIWEEPPRKKDIFIKSKISNYEISYEKKFSELLPPERDAGTFRFIDTGVTDKYGLFPDITSTMRGSQLPQARKALTELLDDSSYVSAEARAVVEAYQNSVNLFYLGELKPKTLKAVVEQRFYEAAKRIALGMSQRAYSFGLGQLPDLGNTFTQRDVAVTMRAGIDRVDLCFDQLYQTLNSRQFREMYVAAVLPRAESLLKH